MLTKPRKKRVTHRIFKNKFTKILRQQKEINKLHKGHRSLSQPLDEDFSIGAI